jgi:hypothetical protein
MQQRAVNEATMGPLVMMAARMCVLFSSCANARLVTTPPSFTPTMSSAYLRVCDTHNAWS